VCRSSSRPLRRLNTQQYSYRDCTVSRFGHFAADAKPRASFIDRTSGFPFIDCFPEYRFENLDGVRVQVMVIITGTGNAEKYWPEMFERMTKVYNSVDEFARE